MTKNIRYALLVDTGGVVEDAVVFSLSVVVVEDV